MLNKTQLEFAKNDPKSFLLQYQNITGTIETLLERIDYLERINILADTGNQISALISEISKLNELQTDIFNFLHTTVEDDFLCQLLDMRFFQKTTIKNIANRFNYTYRWVVRLQARALKMLSERIVL